MKYLLSYLFSVLIITNTLNAQIITDCTAPFDNATGLVNLLIDGIPFSNATLTGFDCASGYFDGQNTNLDMNAGVAMCTGGIDMLSPGSFANTQGTGSDPDLVTQLQLVNSASTTVNNVIVLEFDFEPNSDQIAFQYVFGSEEYPGFTCSNFNDIFGFFLSGPGINGPFTNNAINLAMIPDPNNPGNYTNTPVMINSINSGVSSSGNNEPCDDIDPNWQDYAVFFTGNPNEETVNMPGFTVPLTATASVTPCETYHIKLALANVSDQALQSAVFLLENSFSSTGTFIESSSEYGPWVGNDTTLVEGCFDGELTFGLSEGIQTDYVIDFTIAGTATEGIDFETMGTQAIIPAGSTQTSIPLVPFYDGAVEGDETLSIYATVTDGCSEEEMQFNFLIVDRMPMYMDSLPDTAFCPGDLAITINPNIIGGIQPMTYQWLYDGVLLSNQEIITIQPEEIGFYTFLAEGLCDSEVSDSFEAYLLEPEQPLTILSSYNSIEACLGDNLFTEIQLAGGIGQPQFMWYLNDLPFNDTLNFTIPTELPYEYDLELLVTDQCSNSTSDQFLYSVVDCIFPNVFTPNEDGQNDYFYLNFGDIVTNVRMDIFNRWGQLVYTSINYELCDEETGKHCWNGTDMSSNEDCVEGSYYYTIELFDGRKHKGFFTIFRD
tara:strand:- start:987 stop:2972 length:1986 start_codon:yes stop_codon:yes gene_type:complete